MWALLKPIGDGLGCRHQSGGVEENDPCLHGGSQRTVHQHRGRGYTVDRVANEVQAARRYPP